MRIISSISRVLLLFLIRLLPETRAFTAKRIIYTWLGCEIENGTKITSSAKIYTSGKLIIGENTWIGLNAFIVTSGQGTIKIGRYVSIGPQVFIGTGTHEINPYGPRIAGKGINKDITIGDGVWIGARAVILPGVTIGEMSIIGAGAVVTKDIESYSLAAGIPATVVKHYK